MKQPGLFGHVFSPAGKQGHVSLGTARFLVPVEKCRMSNRQRHPPFSPFRYTVLYLSPRGHFCAAVAIHINDKSTQTRGRHKGRYNRELQNLYVEINQNYYTRLKMTFSNNDMPLSVQNECQCTLCIAREEWL